MKPRVALLLALTVIPALVHAQRSELIIPATKLTTPDQRADTPTPSKWWLNRNAQGWEALRTTPSS
jgi:hypothetical protein